MLYRLEELRTPSRKSVFFSVCWVPARITDQSASVCSAICDMGTYAMEIDFDYGEPVRQNGLDVIDSTTVRKRKTQSCTCCLTNF